MTIRSRIKPCCWFGVLCQISVLFLSTACERLTPDEKKLVGVWEFSGIDTTGRIAFRRDHSVVDLFPEYGALNGRWAAGARGTWRLEGNEIVTNKEVLPIPGMTPLPQRITRTPIREFHEDRFVREKDRSDLIRADLGGQRYAQVLALIYVAGTLIALLTSIYAIRNSSFRRPFTLLAVAAAVALAWSALTLVAEFAQTGALIVSAVSLRSMRLPTEILRVACIVIFAIGFVNLAYRLRVSVPAKDCI